MGSIVLSEEPQKAQLYFCLGLVNERAKGDLASARRDFEQFLAKTTDSDYPREHELVREWIHKIDRRISIGGEPNSPDD